MRRSLLAALLACLLVATVAPQASAEFGRDGPDGWPLAADGTSTNPMPGLAPAEVYARVMASSALGPGSGASPAGEPLNRVGDATLYPYWPMLTAEVQRLASDHPDLVRLTTLGKSTLGLELWMLEIADWSHEGQPGFVPLEDREVVWLDGGTHSNEYSGVYFALAWAQFLVEQYEHDDVARWIVDHRHTWVLPMVNPDGSNAMGRLNAHLVNVNRNYPVIWDGEGHDELMNNRGPTPASEVETQLNIEWFNKTRPDYYASVHCCGNLWLYPYGQEGVDPVDQAMLQKVCDQAFAEVRQYCGPIWSTIYPASGSSVDTAYEYTGTVAFGYEMSGRGAIAIWGQPLTFEDVRTQESESWQGVLHAFLNVHLYGAYPDVRGVKADADGLLVTVHNDGLGNLSAGSGTVTLGMPNGETASAELPALAAGEEAVVRLPCTQDGAHTLSLSYQKRLEPTSNVGHHMVPLTVAKAGEAATVDAGGFLAFRPASATLDAPGLGVPALLALAALATLLRRR